MRRTTQQQVRYERAVRAKQARWMVVVACLLGMIAAPFVPLPYVLAAIACVGGYAAWLSFEVAEINEPPALPPALRYKVPREPGPAEHLYLGHGLDFMSYREGLDDLLSAKGRITDEDQRAYDRAVIKQMRPVHLSDDLLQRHGLIVAPTGVGKSELFQCLAYQQLVRGGGMFLFDAKGDEKLLSNIYAMARSVHREHDVLYLSLDRADCHDYNPILGGNVRQLVSTVMKLMDEDKTKDEYWVRVNRNGLVAAIMTLKSIAHQPRFALTDLATLFTVPELFYDAYGEIPAEETETREFVLQWLNQWLVYDKDGEPRIDRGLWNNQLNGLQSLLRDLCHSEYRDKVNAYNPDIELRSAIMSNKIVIFSLPALSDRQGVRLLGRLIMADLARAVGQIYEAKMRSLIPFLVLLDEYGVLADSSHADLWMQARGAGISLWPSVQSRVYMDMISEEFAESILANSWTHIYADIRDNATRESAAKMAGTTIRQFRQKNKGKSFGYSNENYESGLLRSENEGLSVSDGFREMREDLVNPEDFAMPEGNALMIGRYGTFRMRLPLLEFNKPVKGIDELELPKFEKGNAPGLGLMNRTIDLFHHKVRRAN